VFAWNREDEMLLTKNSSLVNPVRWYLLVVAGSSVYLYLSLFASLRVPFLLGGDQLYFWLGAQQLLYGQIIYRDFFQFTPPGTDLVYAAFFKVLGPGIWVPNLVVLLLGVLLACLCFSLARQLMRETRAALTTGLFLVLIYGKLLNATHHWFAVLLVLTAASITMKRVTERRIALSGTLLGLAAFFNHVHGGAAFLGFVAFLLLWRVRANLAPVAAIRIIAVLTLTCTLVLLCFAAYYLKTVGFERLWFCLVVYVVHYGAQSPRTLGLPAALTSATIPSLLPCLAVYLLLPVIYGLSLWKCWRSRKHASFPWNQVTLLSLIGLSLLVEVAMSMNWLRLFAVSLPGIVLAVWVTGGLPRRAVFLVTSVALTGLAVHQITARRAVFRSRGELPTGRFATTPMANEKLNWLAAHTHPGEFFLQAGWPGVYLPLQLRNPIYWPTLAREDGFTNKNIESAIQQMKAHPVRYVLWTRTLDRGCGLTPCLDDLTPFRTYRNASYRPTHTFEDGDVLWQKIDPATPNPHGPTAESSPR
jgi:hypothetical protein